VLFFRFMGACFVFFCFFVISTSVIDCLGRFVPEMTYDVSSGTLNLTKLNSNPLHPSHYTPAYPFSMSRLPAEYTRAQWYSWDMKVRGKSAPEDAGIRENFFGSLESCLELAQFSLGFRQEEKPWRLRPSAPCPELDVDSSDDPTGFRFGATAPLAMPLPLPICRLQCTFSKHSVILQPFFSLP